MRHYRLHYLGIRRDVLRTVDLFCDDDVQAIWMSKRHLGGPALLLREGPRVVRRFAESAAPRTIGAGPFRRRPSKPQTDLR